MKKIIFTFSLLLASIVIMFMNVSNDTTYALDLSGEFTINNGSPGVSYTAQVRCTTTTTTTDMIGETLTGEGPVINTQINTDTKVKYVTATLCNFYPILTGLCTQRIPC